MQREYYVRIRESYLHYFFIATGHAGIVYTRVCMKKRNSDMITRIMETGHEP